MIREGLPPNHRCPSFEVHDIPLQYKAHTTCFNI